MESEFLSLINAENITKVLAVVFMYMLFIGITDFQKNTEKMGE